MQLALAATMNNTEFSLDTFITHSSGSIKTAQPLIVSISCHNASRVSSKLTALGEALDDVAYGEALDDVTYGEALDDVTYGEALDDVTYGEALDDVTYGEGLYDVRYYSDT